MSSFNVINYSLRPNKSIQRAIVFQGVQLLQTCLDLERLLYVGFGSVWFTDFNIAHKNLHITDMISIEADEIGAKRAEFNRPFKTVRIENQRSSAALPKLLADTGLQNRPWFIWLDYDQGLNEEIVDDMRTVVERVPPNSIFIVTMSAAGGHLGNANGRPERIKKLLDKVVPDDLSKEDCKEEALSSTLGRLLEDYLVAAATAVARPGGFIPAFRLAYKDGTPMITVGGVLPAKGGVPAVNSLLRAKHWPGFAPRLIQTPHLTLKEAAILQAELPRIKALSRKAVQRLGFDLEEEQIRSFEEYYKYYPAFAQITM